MQFLIDTNIIREIMKKEPNPAVVEWFVGLEQINMSVITLEEIMFGLNRKKLVRKIAWFMQFCEDMAVFIDVNTSISLWSGELRADLSRQGISITMADSLIAGTAHEQSLVLATRNTKDFKNIGIALFNPFIAQ